MAYSKEHDVYKDIIENALKHGWLLFRIEDGSYGKKPFDITGASPTGKAVGLEVKLVREFPAYHEPLPYKLLASHQKEWLQRYHQNGGIAIFCLATYNGLVNFYLYEGSWEEPSGEIIMWSLWEWTSK